jgi:uncharacterized membrane protein YczE
MSVIGGFQGGERSATGHCPAALASGSCGHAHATFARRVSQLYLGLVAFGASLALMVRADLGLGPWDVLHQGLAGVTDLSIGWVVIGTAALALLAWLPLRLRPGFGTLSNVIVVGLVVDATIAVLPAPTSLVARVGLLATGIVGNGVATGLYIGAGLGSGPRDGLMMGLAARGYSLRRVRTLLEVAVLAVGWAVGGTVGVGTLAYALAIGPLVQRLIPALSLPASEPEPADPHIPSMTMTVPAAARLAGDTTNESELNGREEEER